MKNCHAIIRSYLAHIPYFMIFKRYIFLLFYNVTIPGVHEKNGFAKISKKS